MATKRVSSGFRKAVANPAGRSAKVQPKRGRAQRVVPQRSKKRTRRAGR